MIKGAAGPVTSALPLFALPLVGAGFLPINQFAMWSILASISTLALSLDFGGPAYLASRLDPRNRNKPFIAATAMTCLGTLAVGLLSICAWIPFSRTDAGNSFTFYAGVQAIAAISFGSALRSVLQLQAQVALFDRRFALRNAILLTHALTALTVALFLLPVFRTAWVLPIAWIAAGVVGILVGSAVFWPSEKSRHDDWEIERAEVASGRTYVWARTLASLFRGFLMQGDRWIIGAIGGPAILAAYEVAWRVAALPRFLAENLTWVVGIDAARVRASAPEDVDKRVTYSIRFASTVLVGSSLLACALYAFLPLFVDIRISWPTFTLLLLAHGAVAAAAPISFVGNGIGIPTIDLPYLALSVGICVLSAGLAYYTAHVYLFIGGMTAALLVGNLWFWRYGRKAIDAVSRRAMVRPSD